MKICQEKKYLNEKLKGMINVKKIFKNGKKVVAGMVLTMMAVCMVSSVAQGANSIDKFGSKKKDSFGYYSYTKVSGFDDKGNQLNLKVGARMSNGVWSYSYNRGTATVNSAYSSSDGTAWHSYQIGSGSIVTWKQN